MSDERKIKVVLLEPSKLARVVEIGSSLESMQEVVGGRISSFCPFEEEVCIVTNNESKINGMRENRGVRNDKGVMIEFIYGPAFICGYKDQCFDSLSDEQINRYLELFSYPERLVKIYGQYIGVQLKMQTDKEL